MMKRYEVVEGKIQTEPAIVDTSIVQEELEEARWNLASATSAKEKFDAENAATIAHWSEVVTNLEQVLNEVALK